VQPEALSLVRAAVDLRQDLLGVGSGMKTDRIQTDITDIIFVFIFLSGFGFEYG